MTMAEGKIRLDLRTSDRRLLGRSGLDFARWRDSYPELVTALTGPAPGYAALPDRQVSDLLRWAEPLKGTCDDLLLLGIGGSGLGARMLDCAFVAPAPRRPGHPRLTVVDNVDPRRLRYLLGELDPRRTLVNVITKSGSTAETMASFAVVRGWMQRALGEGYAERVVAVTDPDLGDLRALATAEGFTTFDVPPDVGGRYSVLSPVGLVPAVLLGIDARELLAGARAMRTATMDPVWRKNPALALALALHQHHQAGRRIVSVMPYGDGLAGFALWFAQLWAESLGKRRKGTDSYGPTPQAALGVTDQHSQLQLYVDGPKDKVVWLIEVEDLGDDVRVPEQTEGDKGFKPLVSLGYLGGRGLGELMHAELRGTTLALLRAKTPSLVLKLPRLDERSLGSLVYMCQAAASITGKLAGVNVYDQPGVEEGKRTTYAYMGRELQVTGYADRLAEDERLLDGTDPDLVSGA
jgi:glucose-6-phosphate isomerase